MVGCWVGGLVGIIDVHRHSSWWMNGKSLESIAALYGDWWIGWLVNWLVGGWVGWFN